MNKKIISAFLVTVSTFLFLSCAGKKSKDNIDLDISLEQFQLFNYAGEAIDLNPLIGKPIILDLWATWCGPCRKNMPYLKNIVTKYGDQIHVILISSEAVEKVKNFQKEKGLEMLNFTISKISTLEYGAKSIPTMYLFDETGKFVGEHVGTLDDKTSEDIVHTLLNSETTK